MHTGVLCLVLGAMVLVVHTWLNEYHATRTAEIGAMGRTWFWIGVGVVGQGLFGLRFLLQWVVTEARRQSVVPTAFWYISLVAALLLAASHLQRHEWVFAVGVATTMGIYARNIWLMRRHADGFSLADGDG